MIVEIGCGGDASGCGGGNYGEDGGSDGQPVKQQKKKVDYISELPDCILSVILSMVSMKDLINTSVLSKRWCNLWHSIRDLKFDVHNVLVSHHEELLKMGYVVDEDVQKYIGLVKGIALELGCRGEFVKRVDQFVKNFKGTVIDSFMVEFILNQEHSNNIDNWIRFAIARGVERIDLLFRYSLQHKDACYKFPFGLSIDCNNNSSTLKHMHLEFCLVYQPTTSFDIFPFTNLRSLVLEFSQVDVILLETLLSNCLLLEELSLRRCDLSLPTLKIVSSSLCYFKLDCCHDNKYGGLKFISLDCPKLTAFNYMHSLCSDRMSMNTPILKTIHYCCCLESKVIHNVFAIFATVPQLETLKLDIINNSFNINDEVLQSIQTMETLRELNLSVNAEHDFDIWWILAILQASPFLQKLTVMITDAEFYANQREIRDLVMFSHNEIKVIEIGGCVGNWYEIEFAMTALKYMHKLERIVLSPHWIDERFGINICGWYCDPTWSLNGRKIILEKLGAEEIEVDKLVLK
ncbi:F-box/LRR-repeat protein At3g58900-like [Lotus japonicus]|uniref:F-box/LRR-repeat protein At3g58900-like n=1 Tax=Lotus japonicus TaxID=34305 RepID=UPI00258DE836|nr:F-box/LRR-repeat protein At3g58900-like [Lotus japonicus]